MPVLDIAPDMMSSYFWSILLPEEPKVSIKFQRPEVTDRSLTYTGKSREQIGYWSRLYRIRSQILTMLPRMAKPLISSASSSSNLSFGRIELPWVSIILCRKTVCSCPVPLPSAKFFLLYFDGIESRSPSKEAQPPWRLFHVLLTADMVLSIYLSSLYCTSRLCVSVDVVVELAAVLLLHLVLNLRPSFHLRCLVTLSRFE